MKGEQSAVGTSRGFLFGAGALPVGVENHESIFREKTAADFKAWLVSEETKPVAKARLNSARSRVTAFNLLAPFVRYFVATSCGGLLVKLGSLMPRVLPSTAHLKTIYAVTAGALLCLDFLCLGLRSVSCFPNSVPFLNPLKNCGRQAVRFGGRTGWCIWYLTQPGRLLLVVSGFCLATGLLGLSNEALVGAAFTHVELFKLIMFVRNLFLVLGSGLLMWGITYCMIGKDWAKQVTGGLLCFLLSAVVSLVIQM